MEQPCQGQGCKGHGAGQRRTALAQADVVGGHDKDADQRALYQQGQHEVLGHDRFLRVSRLLVEQVLARRLHADGDGRQRVGQQVNKQQVYRLERHCQAKQRGVQNAEDGRHVAGQQELDGVFDVGVDISSVGDRLDDGGKVVVGQDHRGRILGNLGAGDAHCDADVRLLERRRVVDAVAGHRDDLALLLPCVDDADLMLRRYAGVDRDVLQLFVQLLVVHLVELDAADGDVALLEDADLLGDGGRGDLVVAGNHHGADAAAFGVGDRLLGFLTRRVDHRDQAHKGVVIFVLEGDARALGGVRILLDGKGQHAQAVLREVEVGVGNLLLILLGDGTGAVAGHHRHAAGQQDVHRSLGAQRVDAVQLVHGAHQFAVGIKGKLRQTRVLGTVNGLLHPEVVGQVDQRNLGRVADLLAVHRGGVVGQDGGLEQPVVRLICKVELLAVEQLEVGVDLLGGHLVLGQGAGFIRADNRDRTQAFHRVQVFDDGVFLCHLLGAHRQNDGDNRAERLRNGGHCQRDSEHQRVQDAHVAVDAQAKYNHADDHDGDGQLLAEVVHALLQRGLFLLGLVHQGRNLADLGLHAGGGDNHAGAAVGDQRPGKDHVLLVAQRDVLLIDDVADLVDALRLTGQRAFIDLQRVVLDNASVRDDQVAGLQRQDIAGDNLFGRDLDLSAVAHDLGVGRRKRLQALQRFFRLEVLDGAEDGVEGDDRHDDDGALPVAGDCGDQRSDDQDNNQQILKLLQKHNQRAFLLSLCQRILSISGALLLNLLGGQALSGYAKLVQNLLGGTAKHLFHLF